MQGLVPLRPTTMKRQIHLLIVRHGLAEVIDRLEELVADEAERRDSHDLEQVALHLEHARDEALRTAHYEWD